MATSTRHVFRASLAEHGFFHPPARCPVGIGSAGDIHVPLKGIRKHFQFFRVSLTNLQTQVTELHLVLSTFNPKIRKHRVETFRMALRHQFPEEKPSFMVDSRKGWVRVSTQQPYPEAAAAVAFVQVFAAWDESYPIILMFDSVEFAARPQSVDGSWEIEILDDPSHPSVTNTDSDGYEVR